MLFSTSLPPKFYLATFAWVASPKIDPTDLLQTFWKLHHRETSISQCNVYTQQEPLVLIKAYMSTLTKDSLRGV